ncbi:hypothetical protein D0B54_22505 [Solimonas sp. K1W22B-7]|uniref:hypothetical protein n=1 Tax=Solimonas sp. K1W22B-7 TaxID=2303331 RepID=UPI000E32EC02|nr:hypothetical protein [Solimonas sp. K1W22B-7]AXQ31282.1 hypothetical protein D0B54_22505 [Solimonas sp. K1W22B-7]
MKRAFAALLLVCATAASAGVLDTALDLLLRSLRSFAGAETLKYSLHYQLEGERVGTGADWVGWRLSGPVRVATVDEGSALWRTDGPVVGQVTDWELRLRLLSSGLPDNTQTELTSSGFRLELDDGSVLTELVDDPATLAPETDIPLQGRMLFELGPIPGAGGPYPVRYRATGCMGVEGSGAGALAGKRGALCIGGSLGFPGVPRGLADLQEYGRMAAESGFTLVMH